jgi:hypothetical protein
VTCVLVYEQQDASPPLTTSVALIVLHHLSLAHTFLHTIKLIGISDASSSFMQALLRSGKSGSPLLQVPKLGVLLHFSYVYSFVFHLFLGFNQKSSSILQGVRGGTRTTQLSSIVCNISEEWYVKTMSYDLLHLALHPTAPRLILVLNMVC